jgi:hypothetical protein
MKQRIELTALEVSKLVASGFKPEQIYVLPENLESLFKTFNGITNLSPGHNYKPESNTSNNSIDNSGVLGAVKKSNPIKSGKSISRPNKTQSAPTNDFILCKTRFNADSFTDGSYDTRAAKLILAAYSDGQKLNRHSDVYPVLEPHFTKQQVYSQTYALYKKGLLQAAYKEDKEE